MTLGVFPGAIPSLGPLVIGVQGIANHTNISHNLKLNVSPTQLSKPSWIPSQVNPAAISPPSEWKLENKSEREEGKVLTEFA